MAIAVTEHTTRAFDADLLDLTRMISEMGGYAERQLIEAVDALSKCDSAHGEESTDALVKMQEERSGITLEIPPEQLPLNFMQFQPQQPAVAPRAQ